MNHKKENEQLKEKLLRYEEKEDNSHVEVPKDALKKIERKVLQAPNELKKSK